MNKQPKRFDLEAAKRGEPILYDGMPATFVAYLPENAPDWRVVISVNGQIRPLTEDGRYCIGAEVRLTMAPRTEKTVGYRAYYRRAAGRGCVLKDVAWEDFANLEGIEQAPEFIRWVHTAWQYDPIEI